MQEIAILGRPDLKADTDTTKEKARLLYHSLQKLMTLKDDIIVLAAHTGSACRILTIT